MGRREDNKRRTRRAISEAALRLFEDNGFEATTVESIAAAAGVSRRTAFRYFPRKEDTLFPEHEERLARVSALMTGPESVRSALVELGRGLESDRERVLQQQALIDASPVLTAADRTRDRRLEDAVAEALRGAYLRDDALLLAGMIMGGVRAVVRAWFASGGSFDLVQRGEAVYDLVRWPDPA